MSTLRTNTKRRGNPTIKIKNKKNENKKVINLDLFVNLLSLKKIESKNNGKEYRKNQRNKKDIKAIKNQLGERLDNPVTIKVIHIPIIKRVDAKITLSHVATITS